MARRNSGGVSLADVAREAGVSTQTVSRVANGSDAVKPDTTAKVLEAMERLGYRPSSAARSLRAGSYQSVGLAMPSIISSTGKRLLLESVITAATKRDYATTVSQFDPDATLFDAARTMGQRPVDGVILAPNKIPRDYDTFIPPFPIPTVILSRLAHPVCPTVENDQEGCAEAIVDYLVQRGHREIRFVAGPMESLSGIGRLHGWKRAMEKHGLPLSEPFYGDWNADSGYEFGLRLLRDEKCTAVFASNDAMAVGVITALRVHGKRVPKDMSVIGVDDSLTGTVPHLRLTTFRFDSARVGDLAFELATGERPIDHDGPPPHFLVPGTIIERATVASR